MANYCTVLEKSFGYKGSVLYLMTILLTCSLCSMKTGVEGPLAQSSGQLKVKIVNEYPHDRGAFTQGLLWHEGFLYESTGRNGRSGIRKVDLETGEVLKQRELPYRFFGEGLALVGKELVQLTWVGERAFFYDLQTFQIRGEAAYEGQGWGLCFDGNWLILSDGSDKLTFRDPRTLAVWKRIAVTLKGRPVSSLNELEYVKGTIYANVWQTDSIVQIDPGNGEVLAVIDASNLPYKPRRPAEDVLNGIAYVRERETFLLTGKLWPSIYEVVFVEK